MFKPVREPWYAYQKEFDEDEGHWRVDGTAPDGEGRKYEFEGDRVFVCDCGEWERAKANAAYIVRCVNSHANLLAALEEIQRIAEHLRRRPLLRGKAAWFDAEDICRKAHTAIEGAKP